MGRCSAGSRPVTVSRSAWRTFSIKSDAALSLHGGAEQQRDVVDLRSFPVILEGHGVGD